MAQNETLMRIRLPGDLKAWLEECSKRNIRSLNAEVVFILRQKMAQATDRNPTT